MDPLDVTVLQPYPGGKIIAGSASGRVLLGDRDGFSILGKPETLKHQRVSGILPISAKETWVSTLGGGLCLWNGEEWYSFDANDGLPDSRLTCVIHDERGSLWLGSLGGIIRVERKELLARVNDPEAPLKWLRLDHTDGMPSRECIGGFQPAGWRGKNGVLWFPTGSGVVRVRPDRVEIKLGIPISDAQSRPSMKNPSIILAVCSLLLIGSSPAENALTAAHSSHLPTRGFRSLDTIGRGKHCPGNIWLTIPHITSGWILVGLRSKQCWWIIWRNRQGR